MNARAEPPKVLLVEDDPVSRAFLEEALTSLGWKVAAFGEAMPALEHARQNTFALLATDRNLPDLSGENLLAALRSDTASLSRTARALALTADADPQRHATLRAAGFDAVAMKPILLDVLAKLLASLGFPTDNATAESFAPATPTREEIPHWDDAAGLRAVGGKPASLAALRQMLQRDLPAQCARIETALPIDPITARAELHKLRAACGFTGAARLGQAVNDLDAILEQGIAPNDALAAFVAAASAIESDG